MARRNPPAKWVLPSVVNPIARRCIQIEVPDDPAHIAAFRGALLSLASAYNWSDDLAHTAKSVALVWRDILDNTIEWGCGGTVEKTLIEYDDLCGLKWSYDNGATWTSISLATCADSEILNQISFQVSAGKLRVSLNGGTEWATIYDAPALADTEILNMIDFQTSGTALRVSLNGGTEWATIYDAAPIADARILADILFQVSAGKLRVSLNGGTEWATIYDAPALADTEILNMIDFQTSGTALRVSLNGGTEWATIYDAAPIADARILADIDFLQEGNKLKATLNGGTEWATIYDPGTQEGPTNPPSYGTCKTYHVTLSGNNAWICPSPVNDGDTIHITNISGAWSDGSADGWYCPDGKSYGLGLCYTVGQHHETDDPLNPGAWHMALIGRWGSTYFNPYTDTYTVPNGAGSNNFIIQANDASLADNLGEVVFDVTVCVGVPASWSHTFDFTTGDNGFTAIAANKGHYVTDVGWVNDTTGSGAYLELNSPTFAAGHLTGYTQRVLLASGSDYLNTGSGVWAQYNSNTGNLIACCPTPHGTDNLMNAGSIDITGVTNVNFHAQINGPNGSFVMTLVAITLYGIGANPFA